MRIILYFAVVFACASATADDIYNFYFQKAPGPQTVIQGGAEKPTAEPTSNPAGAIQSSPPSIATEHARQPYEVTLGWTHFNDDRGSFSGAALAAQWKPAEYFAFEGALFFGLPESPYSISGDAFNGALGLALTPVRMKIFGHDSVSLSLLGGVQNYDVRVWETGGTRMAIGLYAGFGVQVDLTQNFAMMIEVREIIGYQGVYGNSITDIAGVTYRL